MAVIVGTDSYLTAGEAHASLLQYVGADAAIEWSKLDEDDQDALLRRATLAIDMLHFRGVKASRTQPLAWPRNVDGQVSIIPAAIKAATAVQMHAAATGATAESQLIASLQAQGVTSYRLDDFAVTMEKAGSSSTSAYASLTPIAHRLLLPWLLLGGVARVVE